jgi:hypothetical protein
MVFGLLCITAKLVARFPVWVITNKTQSEYNESALRHKSRQWSVTSISVAWARSRHSPRLSGALQSRLAPGDLLSSTLFQG